MVKALSLTEVSAYISPSMEKQTSNMKPEQVRLLLECARRMQELANTPRPEDWQVWLVYEYDEQIEHGPRYGCGEWFGPVPEHQRMRYRRAIDELERGGLLVTWFGFGTLFLCALAAAGIGGLLLTFWVREPRRAA